MDSKEQIKTQKGFKFFVTQNKQKTTVALDIFFKGIKSEADDTLATTAIINAYIATGEITKQQEQFLKKYTSDLLKLVGIGIPFVLLPGASIIIPFVLKAAEKRNINLIPSHFKKNNSDSKQSDIKL